MNEKLLVARKTKKTIENIVKVFGFPMKFGKGKTFHG